MASEPFDPVERYRRRLMREIVRSVDEEIMRPLDSAEADRLIQETGSKPPPLPEKGSSETRPHREEEK